MAKRTVKIDTSRNFSIDVAKYQVSSHFAVVVAAQDCNINGDPARSGFPRMTLNGKPFASAVSVKRKFRERLLDPYTYAVILEKYPHMEGHLQIAEQANFTNTDVDSEIMEGVRLSKNIDLRLFGSTDIEGSGKDGDSSAFINKGMVQVSPMKAIGDRGFVVESHGLTAVRSRDDGKKAMGNDSVKFVDGLVLYLCYIKYNGSACKYTQFAKEDKEILASQLGSLFESGSTTRANAQVIRAYQLDLDSPVGGGPTSFEFLETVTPKQKEGTAGDSIINYEFFDGNAMKTRLGKEYAIKDLLRG